MSGVDEHQLLDQLSVLRERVWCVVLGVATGLAVALLIVLLAPPTYSSRISMYVAAQTGGDSTEAYQGAQFSQARVISYVELVTRPRVTRPVISELGLDTTPDALAKEISASSEQDSVLLDVTVSTHDPRESVEIANAIGRVFPGAVDELERPLRPDATPPVTVRVVEPADTAEVTSPSWPIPVAFGLLGGLVAGVLLALARHATDTSVTSSRALTETAGLPVLATTYAESSPAAGGPGFVPTRDASSSATAEAVRRLRTNLQYVDVDHPPRVLAVTSSVAGEGKTTLACDLAVALAAGGSQVLLLEADLRCPAVAEHFGLSREVGLTSVLAGHVELVDAAQPTSAGVDVLASGPLVPNPSELLASERSRRLVQEAGARYDHVVIDTAPLLVVSDAAAVVPLADGVLLLCRWGSTSRAKLAQSAESLRAVSARALGTVLTMAPVRSAPAGTAAYGHLPAPSAAPPATPPSRGGTHRAADVEPTGPAASRPSPGLRPSRRERPTVGSASVVGVPGGVRPDRSSP